MSRAKRRRAERVGATAEHADRAIYRRYELEGVEPGEMLRFSPPLDQQAYQETHQPLPTDADERRRLRSLCAYCGEQGHRARQCPDRVCFECGQPGHKRTSCPQRAGS